MWEKYHQIRSSDQFVARWKQFLQLSGARASPTLFQHITDIIFNHLIEKHFPTCTTPATQSTEDIPSLDYNERNAVRYISGYITRSVYRTLKDSKHKFKDELCLCLAELNDVDPGEMEDESNEWMNEVDRGGLKHVTNMTYMLFASAELEIRKYLAKSQGRHELNIAAAKDNVIASEDVQFYWCMATSDWEAEVSSVLLDMLIERFVKIRGHSTARAWLEEYKQKTKKSVQKSKGVRKQLISKTSNSTSTNTANSLDIEDQAED